MIGNLALIFIVHFEYSYFLQKANKTLDNPIKRPSITITGEIKTYESYWSSTPHIPQQFLKYGFTDNTLDTTTPFNHFLLKILSAMCIILSSSYVKAKINNHTCIKGNVVVRGS